MRRILLALKPLRQGKFKKLAVSPARLAQEAGELAVRLPKLPRGHAPAAHAGLWALQYLRVRYPDSWWGSRRPAALATHALDLPLRELGAWGFDWTPAEAALLELHPTLGSLWGGRAFKATPLPVHRALLAWSRGDYPLVSMDRVPSVEEVLEQQVRGQRCVTLLEDPELLGRPVLGERDALGFMFHDLAHADHFFHDNRLMRGQVGFYRQARSLLASGAFAPFLQRPGFREGLDYLVADMNAHPVHLWKCLKAVCRRADPAATAELFPSGLTRRWNLGEVLSSALAEMNGPHFSLTEHATALTSFCETFTDGCDLSPLLLNSRL